MTDKYTYAFDEETDYELLRDGADEWVWLTEPEDRTWYRDLAPVLVRLNNQDVRITELEAENARLREFVRYVLYDYLEVDKQTQCPWCLWVPGRSHNPIHECDAVDMMKLVGLRAALQEGSDES